jgi:hypothetical protein
VNTAVFMLVMAAVFFALGWLVTRRAGIKAG